MARQYKITSQNTITDPVERQKRLAEAFKFADKPVLDDRARKLKMELANILAEYELERTEDDEK